MDFYRHKKRNTVYEEATITQPPVKMDMRQKYTVEDENGNLSTVEDEKTQDENVDLTFTRDVKMINPETSNGLPYIEYKYGALVPDGITIIYPEGESPYCFDKDMVKVPLRPRFKNITSTEPFCDKYAFSVLGLIDEYAVASGIIKAEDLEKYTEYQILKMVSEGSIPGVLTKKKFNSVLKELDETLSQYGVSVSAKKYGMQIRKEDPEDPYKISPPLTTKSTLSEAKAVAAKFPFKDKEVGPKKIKTEDPDERTPFMMSVRTVIETLKFGNTDLYEDLLNELETAYKILYNIPIKYSAVSFNNLRHFSEDTFVVSTEFSEDELRAIYPSLSDKKLENITCYSIDLSKDNVRVFDDVHPFTKVVKLNGEVKYTSLSCITLEDLEGTSGYDSIMKYKMSADSDKTLEDWINERKENVSSVLLLVEDDVTLTNDTAKEDADIIGMQVYEHNEGDESETRIRVIFNERPDIETDGLVDSNSTSEKRVTKREIKFANNITVSGTGTIIFKKNDFKKCVSGVFKQMPDDGETPSEYRSKWYVELASSNEALVPGETVLTGYEGDPSTYKVTYGGQATVHHDMSVKYDYESDKIKTPEAADELIEFSEKTYEDSIKAYENEKAEDIVKGKRYYVADSYTEILLAKLAVLNDNLSKIRDRIKEYEKYTGNSVFPSGTFYTDISRSAPSNDEDSVDYDRLCRLLIPVYVGKGKVPKEVTKNGGSYTKYVTKNEKVRFYEINFTDTGVYSRFRDNTKIQGEILPVGEEVPGSAYSKKSNSLLVQVSDLNEVEGFNDASDNGISNKDRIIGVNISSSDIPMLNGDFYAELLGSTAIRILLGDVDLGKYYSLRTPTSKITINNLILMNTDMLVSESDNVSVEYEMPYLPADSIIFRRAIIDYGPFQQEEGVGRSRGEEDPDNLTSGFSPFPETSDDIKSLRKGIGIYEKAAILIKILKQVFSDTRVKVVSAARSMEDQKNMHMGGPTSEFLSWHNYGLAVSIQIMTVDGKTLIKDGSDDAITLTRVAEEFTTACREGKVGDPMNVVWCGTLATGPSLFDWEFLPIGVGHKDAYKFRDAVLSQKDPYVANAYVNVTKNGYVVEPTDDLSNMTTPYIVRGSDEYENGIKINGDMWVPPTSVNNYVIPENLILKNIVDFVEMVQLKQASNGTSFVGAHDIVGWRLQNPLSFKQLMTYYALCGSYSSCRVLMSSEYISRFKYLIDNYYESDPVEFVKEFLGEEAYKNIRVYPSNAVAGSYITLATGKMTMATYDVLPSMPFTNANMFGQQKADPEHMYIGEYDENGVFYQFDDYKKTDESVLPDANDAKYEPPSVKDGRPVKPTYLETDISVIGKYDADGVPYAGDALRIHKQIADQIYNEYDAFRKAIDDGRIPLLYDEYEGSPNSKSFDLLENEFGIIASQDEVPYSQLYDMYNRIAAMSKTGPSNADVKGKTTGNKSNDPNDTSVYGSNLDIYDSLVSTVELTGPRKPSMSAEHVEVEELASDVTIEDAVKQLLNGIRKPNVTDMT